MKYVVRSPALELSRGASRGPFQPGAATRRRAFAGFAIGHQDREKETSDRARGCTPAGVASRTWTIIDKGLGWAKSITPSGELASILD
jgi:hypothetical protein